ncbi:hypothetical protein MTO96_042884 [Rhipicephalus appendiculatus]
MKLQVHLREVKTSPDSANSKTPREWAPHNIQQNTRSWPLRSPRGPGAGQSSVVTSCALVRQEERHLSYTSPRRNLGRRPRELEEADLELEEVEPWLGRKEDAQRLRLDRIHIGYAPVPCSCQSPGYAPLAPASIKGNLGPQLPPRKVNSDFIVFYVQRN